MVTLRLNLAMLAVVLVAALIAVACNGGSGGGSTAASTLEGGGVKYEVELRSAQRAGATAEVRRGGAITQPPGGSQWWAFELRVRNASQGRARLPDVGIACGNTTAAEAETFDDPGFIMGRPPYSTAALDAGGTITGVVPLAVPEGVPGCRLIVKMDPEHGNQTVEFRIDN